MTPGQALARIKAMVKAGNFYATPHVEEDHPDRKIAVGEVVASIIAAGLCVAEPPSRWRVTGPADPAQAAQTRRRSITSICEIRSTLLVISYWRTR
jgi:hypothetical protein